MVSTLRYFQSKDPTRNWFPVHGDAILEDMHELIGWIGAFLFAICAVPQVIKTWKSKKADDLSWLFLFFWIFGEILMLIYIVIDDIALGITHYPLYLNYIFNIVMVTYLLYAKRRY